MNGDSVLTALSLKIWCVCVHWETSDLHALEWTATVLRPCRHGPVCKWFLKATVLYNIVVVRLCICDLKYGGLSIDSGLSMGDLVWLSEVRLFLATIRNFTKAMVWYSSVAVWSSMCELAGHFSVYHSLRTFLKIAPSAAAYLSLVCKP